VKAIGNAKVSARQFPQFFWEAKIVGLGRIGQGGHKADFVDHGIKTVGAGMDQ